jgi:phosphoribosylglycinamide formyltransferase-1
LEEGESRSGITIHYVNEAYDKGAIVLQQEVGISREETPESLAQKIHALEYEYFPKTIASLLFP